MFIVSSLPTSNNLNRTNDQQLKGEGKSKHAMFLATITLRVFVCVLIYKASNSKRQTRTTNVKMKSSKNWRYIEFPVFLQLSPPTFLQPCPLPSPREPTIQARFFHRTSICVEILRKDTQVPQRSKPTKAKARGANSWRKAPKRSWTQKNTKPGINRWFFSCLVLGVPFVGLGGVVSCWGCLGVGYLDDMSFWKARNGSPQKVSWETSCKLHIPTGADDVYTRKT